MYQKTVNSPLGNLNIITDEEVLLKIVFEEDNGNWTNDFHPLLVKAERQLNEYFSGKRKTFDLPIAYEGTIFQKEVWTALKDIPYGTTLSYQELAGNIKRVRAVRAVGQANRRNPLPIIIPCHRVVGKNGSMTGYAGSQTDKKEILLNLEKQFM
ncbi:methylated-DNA--[protein]-cysteine S-methyltransferase [Jeotgalibacillus proteolyticus]|uniref:Methylated-DNA--protein-cysteine methyltransferase n=1 Tax=Jeotgalibacillus proteolyticus TaxID=2082395 RepID=A0A2S5GH48_9BACL|nr:methylated-DNA--[protein]-cysteine S-methyltransferase [Jeotgalibacillus proteolyticus]PPA72244.1 cysteine methyltransferase [Jeotgalibacillus proteolyticus]